MICNLNVEKLILLKSCEQPIAPNFDAVPTVIEKEIEEFGSDIEFLSALALKNEKVVAVRSFEIDDTRVFSVLTLPIYLKSERDELKSTLLQDLSQGKNTYISFDNDIFRGIKEDMSDEQKQKLLETIIAREKQN